MEKNSNLSMGLLSKFPVYAILTVVKDAFKTFNSGRANFVLLAFLVVIFACAVLKLTASVFLPFTIGVLLAFVMYPLVLALDKLHFPRIASIFLVVLLVIVGLCVLGMVFFVSARAIISQYPNYESRIAEVYQQAARFFGLSYDQELTVFENVWNQLGIRTLIRNLTFYLSTYSINFLKQALLVVLFMIFVLVEASHFKSKLTLVFERKQMGQIKQMGNDIIRQVTRYLAAKFVISLITGLVIFIGLRLVGVEFALVWGVIQFILNFIPVLGSIVVGVGASLFALLQFWPEPTPVILVVLVMLVPNMIIGNILDPRIIGENVGISPLVVLISLSLWGFLWGFAGMILAVPLIVVIKIVCQNFPFLEPVSVFLSSRKAVYAKQVEQEQDEDMAEKV